MLTAHRFSAAWCNPCKLSAPIFEAFATENQIPTVNVDIDAAPEWAAEVGVQSIPTVVFYRDGEEVSRLVGPKTSGQLKAAYDNL